jgi:hypothetical protein
LLVCAFAPAKNKRPITSRTTAESHLTFIIL